MLNFGPFKSFLFIFYIGNNKNPPVTDKICWSLEIRYCGASLYILLSSLPLLPLLPLVLLLLILLLLPLLLVSWTQGFHGSYSFSSFFFFFFFFLCSELHTGPKTSKIYSWILIFYLNAQMLDILFSFSKLLLSHLWLFFFLTPLWPKQMARKLFCHSPFVFWAKIFVLLTVWKIQI